MTTISVYDVNDISIIDLATGQPPSSNPITQHESGGALQWNMAYPFDGFEITLGTATIDIDFDDNDGVLSDDPVSGSTLTDQQLTSDLTIAGETFEANSETTLWKNPAPVFVQNEYEFTVFDDAGTEYTAVAVSIGEGYSSTIVGLTFDGPTPPAGSTVRFDFFDSTITNNTSSTIAAPCFTQGALVETDTGPIAIENLKAGDRIKTIGNGSKEIAWIGQKAINLKIGDDHLRPILIKENAIAPAVPSRDVRVSPSHRILMRGGSIQSFFGTDEILVSAKHLLDLDGVKIDMSAQHVIYFHILFDQHEIILTSGLESESFHPGQVGLSSFDVAAREEIFALFPELLERGITHYGGTARPVLKQHEAVVLCWDLKSAV